MDSFTIQGQVEKLLQELGVEPPSDQVAGDDTSTCAMCGLGAHFIAVENASFRQFFESAAGNASLADTRLAGQQHAVVAVVAVAMELALAHPGWVDELLSQLPFDREQTQFTAGSVRDAFFD